MLIFFYILRYGRFIYSFILSMGKLRLGEVILDIWSYVVRLVVDLGFGFVGCLVFSGIFVVFGFRVLVVGGGCKRRGLFRGNVLGLG